MNEAIWLLHTGNDNEMERLEFTEIYEISSVHGSFFNENRKASVFIKSLIHRMGNIHGNRSSGLYQASYFLRNICTNTETGSHNASL